jgi:Amt family ammonium transporter
MQLGFSMLEVGTVTYASAKNILFKNLGDIAVGATGWLIFGYSIAMGRGGGGFWGGLGEMGLPGSGIALSRVLPLQLVGDPGAGEGEAVAGDGTLVGDPSTLLLWTWHFSFAATSATIVSGAIAERAKVAGYLIFAALNVSFVYPVLAHWAWNDDGWLSPGGPNAVGNGMIDVAGSGVVHAAGGAAALMGAVMLGYRNQYSVDKVLYPPRFYKNSAGEWVTQAMEANSESLVALGVLLLWFGWLGFNSATATLEAGAATSALAFANTIVAPAGGIIAASFTGFIYSGFDSRTGKRRLFLSDALNGALAGLVSITGGCGVVYLGSGFVIGAVGGVLYKLGSRALRHLRIDDPVDATPVHLGCGIWGCIAVGFFAASDLVELAYPTLPPSHVGLFYGGSGSLLGMQLLGVLLMVAWSGGWAFVIFGLLVRRDSRTTSTWFLARGEHREEMGYGSELDHDGDGLAGAVAGFVMPNRAGRGVIFRPSLDDEIGQEDGIDQIADDYSLSDGSTQLQEGRTGDTAVPKGRRVAMGERGAAAAHPTISVDDVDGALRRAEAVAHFQTKDPHGGKRRGRTGRGPSSWGDDDGLSGTDDESSFRSGSHSHTAVARGAHGGSGGAVGRRVPAVEPAAERNTALSGQLGIFGSVDDGSHVRDGDDEEMSDFALEDDEEEEDEEDSDAGVVVGQAPPPSTFAATPVQAEAGASSSTMRERRGKGKGGGGGGGGVGGGKATAGAGAGKRGKKSKKK